MPVYQVEPLEDLRWIRFLARHPRASMFHTVAWLTALRRTYGYEPVVFTTSPPGSDLQNALVACRVNSWLTGRRLASLPFSDHCDALVEDSADLEAVLAAMERELRRRKLLYIEVRPMAALGAEPKSLYHSTYDYCFHQIDLRPDLETLFQNCHKNSTQRKIRRAQREGLVYEEGRSQVLVESFYKLMRMTRRRHHIPPQPIEWFKNLVDSFGEELKIRVAFKDGRPIAAIITVRFKDTLVYKYGCSDAEFNNLGGMHLLFWTSIEEAKRDGLRVFDLGRSEWENTGLVTFKDRWGGARSTLTYSRFTLSKESGESYQRAGTDFALGIAKRCFSHLPDRLQYSVGNLFYRHIG